jgi:hypothetical protein
MHADVFLLHTVVSSKHSLVHENFHTCEMHLLHNEGFAREVKRFVQQRGNSMVLGLGLHTQSGQISMTTSSLLTDHNIPLSSSASFL